MTGLRAPVMMSLRKFFISCPAGFEAAAADSDSGLRNLLIRDVRQAVATQAGLPAAGSLRIAERVGPASVDCNRADRNRHIGNRYAGSVDRVAANVAFHALHPVPI